MPGQRTEPPDAPAAEQQEIAISRRRWRGRVLAWLALAVWLAALFSAYQAMWRRDSAQAVSDAELSHALQAVPLGYGLLAGGGLLGAVLAFVGVRQARRDVLAWAALAVNLLAAVWGLSFFLSLYLLLRR